MFDLIAKLMDERKEVQFTLRGENNYNLRGIITSIQPGNIVKVAVQDGEGCSYVQIADILIVSVF